MRWGRRIGVVPARDLDVPRIVVRRTNNDHTPSRADVAAVGQNLRGWHRTLCLLMFATGARIGELAVLTWADINLDDALVDIVDGKTGPRKVPLHPSVVTQLRLLAGGGPVPPYNPDNASTSFDQAVHRAAKKAGIPRFTAHALRRLAVDELARHGVDVGSAAALLGHTPQTMLKHYRRATRDDLEAAVRQARIGVMPSGEVINLRTRSRHNTNEGS